MNVVANGKPRALPDGISVADFLSSLGWQPEWVVVEHNGSPLERTRFGSIRLNDGDQIEVVRAVAGG